MYFYPIPSILFAPRGFFISGSISTGYRRPVSYFPIRQKDRKKRPSRDRRLVSFTYFYRIIPIGLTE